MGFMGPRGKYRQSLNRSKSEVNECMQTLPQGWEMEGTVQWEALPWQEAGLCSTSLPALKLPAGPTVRLVSKNGNREGTTDRVVRDVTQGLISEELPRQRNSCHVLGSRMRRGFQSRDSRRDSRVVLWAEGFSELKLWALCLQVPVSFRPASFTGTVRTLQEPAFPFWWSLDANVPLLCL